ncbi:MAG: YebC/PmpR family DNA-binding transcriptional regulator [Planctomycetaceae bacterium]|jgi:YebC/PmpR family DNA-binding regulatory protein|nr:YebC/PmpR family DNA-binding transcriptional regulator [bacterium]MDG2389408.1 YebC/PmpR family DNA-binding transcriptional regulator [Planctomycetaceae bacterium]
MAGHSHWANIAHKKGRIDAKRGKLFGKLSRAIIVAAQTGGGDPAMNLTLRYAIDKARKASMPNDNIDRAVKKGCGESGGDQYESLVYEGYGPEGVAILCEALTENRNRTGGEIRFLFEKHNGNLGTSGCVAYMFQRKGLFAIAPGNTTEELIFDLALDNGADDVKEIDGGFQITSAFEDFDQLNSALEEAGIKTEISEVTQIADTEVELNEDAARKVMKLIDALEDNDDVQNVIGNFTIPDDVQEVLNAEG